MTWLSFLLSTCSVLVGFLAAGNLTVGLVVVWGFMRGTRCTERDDLTVALAMIFFGTPLFTALCFLCYRAGGMAGSPH